MKPYIKDLLIIVFALLCFVIGCNWNRVPSVEGDVKSDTTFNIGAEKVTVRVDTFIKNIPKPYPVYVYLAPKDSTFDPTLCDSIRLYTESLDDSSGLVVVESTVQGALIEQKITLQSYAKSTFRVDTLIVTNTEKVAKRIFAPTFGLRIDSVAVPSIGLLFSNKRGNIIYGGSVGTKKLSSLRPDEIQIKVGINLNR